MQNLESKLAVSNDLLLMRDNEISKLNGELKRVKCEVSQLSRDLTEEKAVREELKSQSVELVSEIKNSQKKKLIELEEGLEYQKSLVTKRENHICDLEAQVTELRAEIQQCQEQLQKAQSATGQIQQKTARVRFLAKIFQLLIGIYLCSLFYSSISFASFSHFEEVSH